MTRTKVKATATVKVHVHSPMSGKQRPYHVLSSTFCTTCRCALMSKKNMQCNSHHTACFQCDILHVYACSVHVKLMFSTPCRRILRCIAIFYAVSSYSTLYRHVFYAVLPYSTLYRHIFYAVLPYILRCIVVFYATSAHSTPYRRFQRSCSSVLQQLQNIVIITSK